MKRSYKDISSSLGKYWYDDNRNPVSTKIRRKSSIKASNYIQNILSFEEDNNIKYKINISNSKKMLSYVNTHSVDNTKSSTLEDDRYKANKIYQYLIYKNGVSIVWLTSKSIFIIHFLDQITEGLQIDQITFPTLPTENIKKIIDMNFDIEEFLTFCHI